MLRARGGDVDQAADRFVECLPAVDAALRYAQAYEAAPAERRQLRDQYSPVGIFGCDKRGAPVMYSRLGLADTPGLVRETSLEFFVQAEFYHNLLLWDALARQSVAQGVALQGALFVIDISGCYTSMAYAAYKVMSEVVATAEVYPAGEHPMPEGMRKCLVCGAPWWMGRVWQVVQMLLPARTIAKFSLYRDDAHDDFMAELTSRVDLDQIPKWCGGQAEERWPYGEGGELPDTTGSAAANGDKGASGAPPSERSSAASTIYSAFFG